MRAIQSPGYLDISIHSPRMGRDPPAHARLGAGGGFQSTLPAWGETQRERALYAGEEISIHSPRMGRDQDPAGTARGD